MTTKKPKVTTAVLHRLMKLFEGFTQAHGTHGTPERDPEGLKWNIKRTAATLRQEVTEDLWIKHVDGERPLGIIPIREDNTCSWGSIDFDVYDYDLLKIVKQVEDAKLPLVPCISKSGGLHLFLFLKEPESAADVQNVLRETAASLGMAKCEIFPKQQRVLLERNDLGNWMVMPYFGGTFNNKLRFQRGLKRTGAEMSLAEFVTFAEGHRTTVEKLIALTANRRAGPDITGKGNGKKASTGGRKSKGDFSDGPPCLQHLISGEQQQSDGRKRMLFMMGMYYKRADTNGWKARLDTANQTYFKPPLPSEEVLGVVRSLDKKDYEYTCKEEPMHSHCNSVLCRTRKFGVGKAGEYPTITSLSKLQTEPPVWFVDVEGERLELTTEELQSYVHFHRACMAKIDKCYRNLRQDVWLSILSEAMVNVQPVPAPPEIGLFGRFNSLLREFLTNRSRGIRPEDLMSGRPYEEDGRHYFKIDAIMKFLQQEGFKVKNNTVADSWVMQRIIDMKGGRKKFNFSNAASVRTFWVPASAIEDTPDIPAPKMDDEEDF